MKAKKDKLKKGKEYKYKRVSFVPSQKATNVLIKAKEKGVGNTKLINILLETINIDE